MNLNLYNLSDRFQSTDYTFLKRMGSPVRKVGKFDTMFHYLRKQLKSVHSLRLRPPNKHQSSTSGRIRCVSFEVEIFFLSLQSKDSFRKHPKGRSVRYG